MADTKNTVKRFRKPLRIIAVLLILAAFALWGVNFLARPADRTNAAYYNFVVDESDSKDQVAQNLYESGIIPNPSRFVLLSKISMAGAFRPGTYFLSPSEDSLKIIHTLTNGLTTSQGFTLPPGLTVEQIATELDRDGFADKDKFLEAASSPDLLQIEILQAGLDEHPEITGTDIVQGFLLPQAYTVSSEVDESMMVIMMVDAFSNFFNEDYKARAEELGVDVRTILCIASVIEKETAVDSEKKKISAVLHNRYNLEMTSEEEIYSVPLCNPSKESIIAALYPEDTEDTYYVLSSKLDGTHRFTSDEAEYQAWLEEYNAAVDKKRSRQLMTDVRDEKLKAFADSYFRSYDDELEELRLSDESENVPLIMRETEGALRILLGLLKPKNILELGTAHGYSALLFAKLCPDAHITTIDRNPYMIDDAKAVFESHREGERIEFRVGEALETLKGLKDEFEADRDKEKFDFVFIDAGKSHYRDFLEVIEDMITDDAYIACDNILMKGWIVEPEGKDAKRHRTNIKYMRQFLDYIHGREDLEVTLLSGADGLAIIRYR